MESPLLSAHFPQINISALPLHTQYYRDRRALDACLFSPFTLSTHFLFLSCHPSVISLEVRDFFFLSHSFCYLFPVNEESGTRRHLVAREERQQETVSFTALIEVEIVLSEGKPPDRSLRSLPFTYSASDSQPSVVSDLAAMC